MKKVLIMLVIVVLAGAGYYALSPLFNTIVVNDPLPEAATEAERATKSQGGFENLSPSQQISMEAQMDEVNASGPIEVSSVMISLGGSGAPAPIMHTVGHPAAGTVRVLNTPEGTIARFENFKTINGPDLHVYLAKDLDASEFVDLGPIRGTEGNINYTVPSGVNVSEYKYIMHWCVPFGVLFNFAELRS